MDISFQTAHPDLWMTECDGPCKACDISDSKGYTQLSVSLAYRTPKSQSGKKKSNSSHFSLALWSSLHGILKLHFLYLQGQVDGILVAELWQTQRPDRAACQFPGRVKFGKKELNKNIQESSKSKIVFSLYKMRADVQWKNMSFDKAHIKMSLHRPHR